MITVKISRMMSILFVLLITASLFFASGVSAKAEDAAPAAETETVEEASSATGTKAIAAAAVVAVVAAAGALGMALAVSKSTESMARQPEAADRINSSMMLGLVFIETAIIYALIVAILVIFVL